MNDFLPRPYAVAPIVLGVWHAFEAGSAWA
jgi:hypothetical protein